MVCNRYLITLSARGKGALLSLAFNKDDFTWQLGFTTVVWWSDRTHLRLTTDYGHRLRQKTERQQQRHSVNDELPMATETELSCHPVSLLAD